MEWLSDWPVDRPRNWREPVNAAETPAELEALKISVARGRPFGEAAGAGGKCPSARAAAEGSGGGEGCKLTAEIKPVPFSPRFLRSISPADVIPEERLIETLPSEFDRWREPMLFGDPSQGKH